MSTLFDIFLQFWQTWFGPNLTDQSLVQLLAVVSTIALVYAVIVFPVYKIFHGRRK